MTDQKITNIRPSIAKHLLSLIFFAMLMAQAVRVSLHHVSPPRDSTFLYYLSCAVIPLYAVLVLFNLYGIVTFRRPIITLSPDGLLDRRLSSDFIPWQSIERINAQGSGRYKRISILIRKEWKEQLSPALQAYLNKQSKDASYRTILIVPSYLEENAQDLTSSIRICHHRFGEISDPSSSSSALRSRH